MHFYFKQISGKTNQWCCPRCNHLVKLQQLNGDSQQSTIGKFPPVLFLIQDQKAIRTSPCRCFIKCTHTFHNWRLRESHTIITCFPLTDRSVFDTEDCLFTLVTKTKELATLNSVMREKKICSKKTTNSLSDRQNSNWTVTNYHYMDD